MLSSLMRLLGLQADRPITVEHPLLGTLRYDREVSAWRAIVETKSRPIGFLISGAEAPDGTLIQHAAEIAEAPAEFQSKVRAFLEHEAAAQPEWAAEIAGLSL